jgi:hypothetical protein
MKLLKTLLSIFLIASLLILPCEAKTPWTSKPPLGSQINWGHPLSRGLVGCFLFNEGGGNLVRNSAIEKPYPSVHLSNNNGTIVGADWVGTQKGIGLYFNGSSDYITHNDVFDVGTFDFSYSCWFRAGWTAANEFRAMMGKTAATGATGRYYLIFNATKIEVQALNGLITIAEAPYLDGRWHHAIVTIDRDANALLYIDTILKGTADVSAVNGVNYDTTFHFGIGAYTDAAGTSFTQGWFNGNINNVLIWRRALSPSEIQQLYVEPYCFIKGGGMEYATTTSAALTGTVTTATEADIRAGGKTIILTLTGDTWVTTGATFDAQRQNIINGIDSAQSEATGWDAEVKAKIPVTDVVRTSDTVVTITLSAEAAYDITATETMTATIPATALTGNAAIVASPTFQVTVVSAGGQYMTCNRGYW